MNLKGEKKMKKEWKNPAVEELNFTNTNNDELIKCPEDNEVDFLGCAPDHTGNARCAIPGCNHKVSKESVGRNRCKCHKNTPIPIVQMS